MFFETKDEPANDELTPPFPIKDLLESVNMEVENLDELGEAGDSTTGNE